MVNGKCPGHPGHCQLKSGAIWIDDPEAGWEIDDAPKQDNPTISMNYSLDHDKDIGICIIRVWGENKRPDDSMELQKFARDYKAETGCSKYLFDMREATIIGDKFAAYETATAPLTLGMKPYEYRVALVYTGDLSEHTFMELVAMNRGYSLKVFDDYERARHWLSHSKLVD